MSSIYLLQSCNSAIVCKVGKTKHPLENKLKATKYMPPPYNSWKPIKEWQVSPHMLTILETDLHNAIRELRDTNAPGKQIYNCNSEVLRSIIDNFLLTHRRFDGKLNEAYIYTEKPNDARVGGR